MRSQSPEVAAADAESCAALLRQGSRTFHAAARVLPAPLRLAATGLYAFCRLADDAVDRGSDGLAELDALRRRLARVYDGQPDATAVDRAFASVVARYAIPRALPEALLEGFEWDVRGRRYRTLSELLDYAARVAGSVGAMMAMIMGVRDEQVLARACELGVAMQLTNIARDVGEDARMGRVYLPCDWLAAAGIDPDAWLAAPRFSTTLGELVERLLSVADQLYAGAGPAISQLPLGARPGMHAARLLYAEIGQELRRRRHDSVDGRAVVPWMRKGPLLAVAILAATSRASSGSSSALPEIRFLVEAAAAAPPPRLVDDSARDSTLDARIAWLVDLFERLERRDRELAAGSAAAIAGERG